MSTIFQYLIQGFLFPGTLVLKRMGVDIEDDGGILRSFINMCFWGTLLVLMVLGFRD
ncbi:MAG: hypothetical protein ACR2O3_01200 [Rhizobiaceae bacterium]